MKDLRILHILSPVKWIGDIFNSNSDSNWKLCEKTIRFLPYCHHYVLVPMSHNIRMYQNNVTFIKYDYPKSVQLNRGIFDYRQIKLDFTRIDIDFVFNHQPELTYNIHQWFSTSRYYEDVSYFGFYHWIDCKQSRGSLTATPTFYMRQLEAMHLLDYNFIHSELSKDYLLSNFKDINAQSLLSKIAYMPVTSNLTEPTPFDLPNKKILVFNHRWNDSSGIKKLVEYTKDLSNEFLIWVTDESCDIKNSNFFIKNLQFSDYCFLLKNCYASLCFIDGYSTWNLSAQDSMLMGRPLIFYKHPTIQNVVGQDYNGYFENKDEFLSLLENLPNINLETINNHDSVFQKELYKAMDESWYSTKKEPKDANEWIKNIKNGITEKNIISNNVNSKIRLNSSAHFIRRYLLHNGIKDNIKNPYTEYYIEGHHIKKDLFS